MSLTRWKLGFLVSLAAMTFVLAGCGSGSGVQTTDSVFALARKTPATIVLSVEPPILPADGLSQAQILARVYDDQGHLVQAGATVYFDLQPTPGSPARGSILNLASTDLLGLAPATFTAGSFPGVVTITARAGRAQTTATISLVVPFTQTLAVSASASQLAGTTNALDIHVFATLADPSGQARPAVNITLIDQNGAPIAATIYASGNGLLTNGTVSATAFLTGLTPSQRKTGVTGFVVVTIGGNGVNGFANANPLFGGATGFTALAPFTLSGTGTVSGGSSTQQFPDSVIFTPSSVTMAVRNGATISIPVLAQFPLQAVGSQATFTLNPNFRSANANGITGFFTPPSPGGSAGDTQTVPVSSNGTAATTLVLTNVSTSQLGHGLVLAVNVASNPVVNGVPYSFFGNLPITLEPQQPQLALLSLAANPSALSVSIGGSFSVTLTARVQAVDGSFPGGQFVTFTSDQSRGVIFPTTAATDATGTANSTFSLSQIPAALLANGLFINMRATVPNNSGGTLSATTSVFVSPAFGVPDHLVVSSAIRPNPTTSVIFVQGSAFPTVTQITYDVLDINDNLARSSTDRVEFLLENGGLHGGESLEPGAGPSITTGAVILNGHASTILRSGVRAGTVRVIAFIDLNHNGFPDPGEPRSEPITISISGGLPSGQNLSIVAQHLNIPGLIEAGISDIITAYLADRFNNPVIAGTRVSFTSYDAVTLDSAASITANTATAANSSQGNATLISQQPEPNSGFVGVQTQTNAGIDATVLSLAQDPTNAGLIYAGSDGGGVYQGTFSSSGFLPFGNMAWKNVGTGKTGLENGYIRSLAIDPRAGLNGVLYAGTERGLFRSTGSGGIWISREGRGRIANETPSQTADPSVFNLAFPAVPLRARTFVTESGVSRFDFVFNSPTQIQFLASGAPNPVPANLRVSYDYDEGIPELVPVTSLTVSRNPGAAPNSDNAIVYAGTLGNGVYRSTNGGFTWIPINSGLSNTNVLSLALARMPGNTADVVLLAGTQGGGVFKLAGGAPPALGGNFRVVGEASIPDSAATTQLQWTQANTNLTATQVLSLATDPDRPVDDGTPFRVYAGTDVGGVFRTTTNNLFTATAASLTWAPASRNVSASDLANTRVTAVAVEPATRDVFAATLDDQNPMNPIGGLFRSTDNGDQFFPIGSPLSGNAMPLGNTRLRALAVGGGNLWIGGDGRQVWLSTNAATPVAANVTFTEVGTIGTLGSGAITVNPQLDNNIYDTTRVLFSGDPIVRITPLSSNPQIALGGTQRFLVTLSDANGNPLPSNTLVCVTSSPKGTVSGGGTSAGNCPITAGSAASISIPDTQQGGTDFVFDVANDLAANQTVGTVSGDTGITIRVSATVFTPDGAHAIATGQDVVARTLKASAPLTFSHINPPSQTNQPALFTITGGTSPYQVLVTGNATPQNPSVNAQNFTVTPTGGNGSTYTVLVTDAATNSVSKTFTIGVN